MTDERSQNSDPASSGDELLTAAFRTPALNQDALERVRAAVEQEWRAATTVGAGARKQPTAPSSRLRWFAAAAVVAAVGVASWVARPPAQAAPLGSVSRTDEGALSVLSAHFPRRNLTQGGVLRAGDRVWAQGPALVALARGGTLRISAIITNAGAIEHVGTEFEVLSDDAAVRVRVREGRIRFVGRTGTVVADAGTELLAAPGKSIVQRPIETYGRDWLWTAALAPDYEIEGSSLIGFLRWVSRELGRPLNFADANARQIADRTILHGSVRHQAPIDAMSNVLATTSLTYEIRGDAIWVRSGTSAAL